MNPPPAQVAKFLAEAMLAGDFAAPALVRAAEAALGKRFAFAKSLAARVIAEYGEGCIPRQRLLAQFLMEDAGFLGAWERHSFPALLRVEPDRRMRPSPGAPREWRIPALPAIGDIREWLGVELADLFWFADQKHLEARGPCEPLRHYYRRWIPKPNGGARLLESPKPRLKAIQRRILHEILDHVPPHEAAHGFRANRSTRTFAEPHVRQTAVLRMDLADFFTGIGRSQVMALFMTAGYPEPAAGLLSCLCCTAAPPDVMASCPARLSAGQRWQLRKKLQSPHLPQGAPTSPALANLCAFRLDCRLAGLAKAAGAEYTRYADDLAFSGGPEFARQIERFQIRCAAIALEEGFQVNYRKIRVMRRSASQRMAGIVVNDKPNIPRRDFDRLKAILHNCATRGPETQNREALPDFRAHLAGRIAQVSSVAPERGAKLAKMLAEIRWT